MTHQPGRASEQAFSDARRRIGADEFHAWVAVADPGQAAAWHPGPGPLEGIAVGVKDVIDLAGMPTRCGSPITLDTPVARSAVLVERLIGLGAMPVGKTVTTEFAFFAPGPTQNPRAPGHTPGGSSSGSAAAVAAGHVPLALGSQTAGSLIRPAAYCGVAGLVLRHDAVPLEGFSGLAPSLDAAGLMAPTVAGLRAAHEALFPAPPRPSRAARALVWHGDDLDEVSPDMRAALERAAQALRGLGLDVEPLGDALPMRSLAADHLTVMQAEVARERQDLMAARERLSPQLRGLLDAGAAVPTADYAAAIARTTAQRARIAELLGEDTVVLGPAAPGAAPAGLGATGSPVMSRPWQLLGLPQLAVAGSVDAAGLPLGVQLVARGGAETMLLTAGELLEARLAER